MKKVYQVLRLSGSAGQTAKFFEVVFKVGEWAPRDSPTILSEERQLNNSLWNEFHNIQSSLLISSC